VGGRRAARPIKQSDRPTRTCGGRRRRRFLFRLTDRGDEELELGWSWRPPLRPDADVGFAGAAERLPAETPPTMVAHRNCYRNWAALTISLRFLARARGEGTTSSPAERAADAAPSDTRAANSFFCWSFFCWWVPDGADAGAAISRPAGWSRYRGRWWCGGGSFFCWSFFCWSVPDGADAGAATGSARQHPPSKRHRR
jgi:hypothetical protein